MNTTHTSRSKIEANQSGLVSIMVTMIFMIILSLIVLGFAQISRRNQRVTLDRQLSTQAFYAAETGVNDALNAISTAGSTEAKTTCGSVASGIYSSLNPVLNASGNVEYTCLLVNPTPTSLQYNNVDDTGTIVPIISADGSNISDITLTWQSDKTNPLTNCPASLGTGTFTPTASWQCGYGVLRFDLVNATGAKDANGYQATTMTTFAVPLTTGLNQIAYGPNSNATAGVKCTDTNCTLKIVGLNASNYYMRMSFLYNKASVMTVAPHNAAGSSVQLAHAQALIDATGKAQDVLRRIQVRVPYDGASSTNQLPMSALSSNDSICKRFSVMDGWAQNSPDSITGTNALCQP